ncbi:ATP-binding protein [Bradyrhizobium sp. Pa8]|uniref:ATP-binding protein n=1 Tax=Bradyrhizobium sp. Pa8 TaxID=3386552 RepID=UPI00403F1EDD
MIEVKPLTQRTNEREGIEFGSFRLIVSRRLLLKHNKPVTLGSRALDILAVLVERAGEVVSHKELLQRVWSDLVVEEANIRVHIAALRRILGDGLITTVAGRGYCLVASIRHVDGAGPATNVPIRRLQSRQLPPKLLRMIGRDGVLETLHRMIQSRRFVTIVGPGGVGKSTVAVALAYQFAGDFEDATSFVDLSTLRDSAFVVSAIASVVGCVVETQDSLPRLLAFLADRRILIVLDNCEHVIDSVAALTEGLFREAPLVHIIATSREALRVHGENVYPLQSLDGPSTEPIPSAAEARTYPAVQLFIDRSIAAGYRQELTEKDVLIAAEICRQLDGIPLALELAASKAATYGIGGLAQRVGDRLMLLWKGRRGVPRHETLAAMLDWSYDLLTEPERSVLRSLSVFVEAFTLDMAQAVASGSDPEDIQTLDIVASLVDKSLISVSRSGQAVSYRLLDTTRTHAAVKLRECGDESVILRRHASYFAAMLADARIGDWTEADLEIYARYIGDVRAALEWSFSDAGDRAIFSAIGVAAVPLFLAVSLPGECRRWCLRTLAALSDDVRGTKLEMELQLALATSSQHAHNDTSEVLCALERGLVLADSLGDAAYQLELLAGLNVYGTRFADAGPPLAAAKRYASIATTRGNAGERVTAEWMLGSSYHLIGDQASALQNYERGHARAKASGLGEIRCFGYDHRARALVGYARTLWLCGHPDQAIQFAREGIELVEREPRPASFDVCLVLAFAIPMFLWRGDFQVAEKYIEQLIAHANRYSLKSYQAAGLGMHGELMMMRGETEPAVEALRAALPVLQSERRFFFVSACSRALAQALMLTGRAAEAPIVIDAVLGDAAAGGGHFELPELMRTRSEALLAASSDNWPEAEATLEAALELARRQSAIGWELRSAMMLSRQWRDRGRNTEAQTLLAGTLGRFTEGFETLDLCEAARQLREFNG